MANQYLALSLFVMLLSFFIILNSLSNFEETKSQETLNSISVAFSNQKVDDDILPNIEESVSESFKDGDTLTRLEGVFNAHISGLDVQKNRLGTVMHVRINVEDFEKNISIPPNSAPSTNQPIPGQGVNFLPTLASVLLSEEDVPYRMDMILNIDQNPASALNESAEIIGREAVQVSGFANTLEKMGLPSRLVTAGLGGGPKGTMDIYFHRYYPFDPLGKR